MSSYPAVLEQLVRMKRHEWAAMLLAKNPRLRPQLSQALQLLDMGRVRKHENSSAYYVRGNPHDYLVNVAQRVCSCGKPACEHFLAAWFALSEEEIVRERLEAPPPRGEADEHTHHGRWQGPHLHICEDGYRERSVYGIGRCTECIRCRTPYCAVCDENA